jgi:hypothetical protein
MDPARYPVQDYPSNTGSVGVNPPGKAELEKNTNINSKKKEKLIKRKNNKKNNKNKNKKGGKWKIGRKRKEGYTGLTRIRIKPRTPEHVQRQLEPVRPRTARIPPPPPTSHQG